MAIKIYNESSVNIDELYVSEFLPDKSEPSWNAAEKDSSGIISNLLTEEGQCNRYPT